MMRSNTKFIFTLVVCLISVQRVKSFISGNLKNQQKNSFQIHGTKSNNDVVYENMSTIVPPPVVESGRRQLLVNMFGMVATVGTTSMLLLSSEPASATYSAFTHREEDWSERKANGEIQVKTARDLRRQLAEIAPMNTENSKLFCPNGPSAAVSPLMENRCGDRLAIPSVYGRTEDALGNSIPGFNGGFYTSNGNSGSSNGGGLASELSNVGYGFTTSGRR